MHIAVDPAKLILPRGPITADGVDVAVDETGRKNGAFSVYGGRGSGGVDIFKFANRANAAAGRYDSVGVENGIGEVSAEQEADVADDQFGLGRRFGRIFESHSFLRAADLLRRRAPAPSGSVAAPSADPR